MKKRSCIPSRLTALFLLFTMALSLTACREKDPNEGKVEVYNGQAWDWITPWEGVEVSALTEQDFYSPDAGETVHYTGDACRVQEGIDVSYYQGDVDWKAVAADGIEFAMIRAGYRGYTDGYISKDPCFLENAAGALAAGLEIGLYIFSQATTAEEAREEAQWLVDAASDYDVTLPLVFDWEPITDYEARTDGMMGTEITACAEAFCDTVRAAGYMPGVYFSAWQGYYDYDLGALSDAEFWVSQIGSWDEFYYAHGMWQYTFSGRVDGITSQVDRDLRYVPAE